MLHVGGYLRQIWLLHKCGLTGERKAKIGAKWPVRAVAAGRLSALFGVPFMR